MGWDGWPDCAPTCEYCDGEEDAQVVDGLIEGHPRERQPVRHIQRQDRPDAAHEGQAAHWNTIHTYIHTYIYIND